LSGEGGECEGGSGGHPSSSCFTKHEATAVAVASATAVTELSSCSDQRLINKVSQSAILLYIVPDQQSIRRKLCVCSAACSAHLAIAACFACCFCHCTGGGECKILALRTCTRNGFNLISLIKGAAQLELQHHVANKAIYTQKQTEV
jgi:hypothetical protein